MPQPAKTVVHLESLYLTRYLRVYTLASTLTDMITWDESKRLINRDQHGVDFADLEAFFDGDLLTREDAREA
ncbi:hypothetical protein CKO42_05885 [Lamprobacter modestohalophilus]|uniref:Uncharacterized protein n=1 Tax=Lamprobacter modestohalophilus TaxID=1064514 RepID=A0A9X0W716_9GAMM|nr:BrnT family toxin [Lamprobacter modestohalophilus]MBK1617989.1 hypothetical protein [Lamprobacter modestohalophilus]